MHSWLRNLYIVYFATHIPITFVLDLQAILGNLYPRPLQKLLDWYIAKFKGRGLQDQDVYSMLFCIHDI